MSHSLTEPAIFGNEPPTETAQPEIFTNGNEVATEAADAKPAAIQSTPLFYCRLNLVAAVDSNLRPTGYEF
jgi:hypothetical protein